MLAGSIRTRAGAGAGTGAFSPARHETNRAKKFAKAAQIRCRPPHVFLICLISIGAMMAGLRIYIAAFSLRRTGGSFSQDSGSGSGGSSLQLPVYWIDDSSASHAVEAALGRYPHVDAHRVPKISIKDAVSAVNTGAFRALRASVVKMRPLLSYVGGADSIKVRTYTDVSQAMTHLNAVHAAFLGLQKKLNQHAYSDDTGNGSGNDVVLIIDGKMSLLPDFAQFIQGHWKACLASAPADWKLLQLHTTSAAPGSVLYDHNQRLSDDWISWQGDHFGSSAYFINLGGMQDIIRRTRRRVKNSDVHVWAVPAWEGPTWPDDILFYVTTTYTAARSWWRSSKIPSRTAHAPPKPSALQLLDPQPHLISPNQKIRPESVLVIQTSFIRREHDVQAQIRKIRADVEEMCKWHKRVEWKVTMAFRYQSQFNAAKRSASLLPEVPTVVWNIVWAPGRFNKFQFVKPHVNVFSAFDVVLIKDSDQRIAGFPWNTFMEARRRSGHTMIAGPLREAPLESRYHKRRRRHQWFQVNDASYWKLGPEPFQERYRYIQPWPVTYVEQYFAVFDGAFASWFFGQVLLDKFMLGRDGSRLVSSWGPDFMWCGAAATYISSVTGSHVEEDRDGGGFFEPCLLVPVASLHEDSRQIERNKTRTHAEQMAIDLKPVLLYEQVFPEWLAYSRKFRYAVGGVGL
jgi:hypothetical protein